MPDFDVIVTGGPGAAGTVVVDGSPSSTSGEVGGVRTYISDTSPTVPGPWLWWDTSGGDLTLWLDDGEA